MKDMLTFKERKYAQKLINSPSSMDTSQWPEWAAWVLYALGGFLVISVSFLFLENPHALTIKFVLLPGVSIGMGLMLVGAYIQHMTSKAEEQQILASLLKKLMA